jgi:hypothetical protein
MLNKIYKCFRCGKVIDRYNAVRLTKKLYGVIRYQQFTPVDNFDFCPKCYRIIEKTFEKWRKENE